MCKDGGHAHPALPCTEWARSGCPCVPLAMHAVPVPRARASQIAPAQAPPRSCNKTRQLQLISLPLCHLLQPGMAGKGLAFLKIPKCLLP